jgi:hypothetical protein
VVEVVGWGSDEAASGWESSAISWESGWESAILKGVERNRQVYLSIESKAIKEIILSPE